MVVLLCLSLCLFANTVWATSTGDGPTLYESGPIKHVVVLMYENRAFDHMLGYLHQVNSEIDGLTGQEYNYLDPYNPSEENKITVNFNAPYVDPDLGHSVHATATQIQYGSTPTNVSAAPMNGFAAQAAQNNPEWGPQALSGFNTSSLGALSTLALEFAVCDKYHASVPGPTEVNRMYVHTATSDGAGSNDDDHLILGYDQTTIYDNLNAAGIEWGAFYSDVPSPLVLRHMRRRENLARIHQMHKFKEMCEAGTLPAYSFLDPAYFSIPHVQRASDQHPSHDVVDGEKLLKRTYEALRHSPLWNSSVLVINYDEHGGFYDHLPTPLQVPNPDGKNSTDPPFDFTRIGVRVPAVLISPWIEKGTVLHRPTGPTNTSEYEHSSVPATLKKLFGLPDFLTARDAWAGTFETLWQQRSSPRTDCPLSIPVADHPSPVFAHLSEEQFSAAPMSELQREFVVVAHALAEGEHLPFPAELEGLSEADAGRYVVAAIRKYFAAAHLPRD